MRHTTRTLLFFAASLLPASAGARPFASLEARWPAISGGSASPDKSLDVSVKGPCLLIMKVALDPVYHPPIASGVRWGNGGNTIPPFPLGRGGVESKTWENGVIVNRRVKQGARMFSETRFKITQAGPHGGKLLLIPPQRRNLAGAFMFQNKQHAKVTFERYPLDSTVPWEGDKTAPSPPAGDQDKAGIDDTTWSITTYPQRAGAGVWVFRSGGRLLGFRHKGERQPAWTGTWKRTAGGILCHIRHQGVDDWFLVVHSGSSLEAFKSDPSGKPGAKFRVGTKG